MNIKLINYSNIVLELNNLVDREINNDKYEIKNICCIGAGYVGGPTMTIIAAYCPTIKVSVVDINADRIKQWNGDINNLPIYEPGLSDIVSQVRNKNLYFSTDLVSGIKNADMIFISVNTPIKTKGLGAGQASDLKWVESSAREIAKYAEGHTIVVEKSTLPVKTAEIIKSILTSAEDSFSIKGSSKTFSVLSNPEFLAEGTAVENLRYPDRVLIGGEDQEAIKSLRKIYLNWVPKEKIYETNLWSSELSKLIANAFLAQRISSINSVSAICELTGANVEEVSNAVGSDSRIGNKFLNSGPGFGGSCFKKDILNLVYICRSLGLEEVASYWECILNINDWQQDRVYKIIMKKLYGNLVNKKIVILGFSFKANTNDVRNSPSIEICKKLINEGAKLIINDPKVTQNSILTSLVDYFENNMLDDQLIFNKDISKAVKNSDAIVILTDWEEYKNLNWEKLYELMRKPAWIFDTRSVINLEKIKNKEINIWQLGNGESV